MEGSDLDTRRRIACELLKGIATNYKAEVTSIVSSQIQELLTSFSTNPMANWKNKDCAIFLVVSLSTRKAGSGGGVASTDLVDVQSFFTSVIVPELQTKDVNDFPLLKAGALKFFTLFRHQIPKDVVLQLIPDLVRFLTAASCVVHSYAANCIEKLLLVKDEGGKARYNSLDIAPVLPAMMTNLFAALAISESEENQYVMKCIMRVLGLADITPQIAAPSIAGLTSILSEVCKNPKNPVFNHYLFESVAVLVRRACEADAGLISSFEASLFPSLQTILANDVAEFFPYAFQLLAQLVDLNRPPIPATYMPIFQILLSPELWGKRSNVPALVRLLQAFLQKSPHELSQGGRLIQVLDIFNGLMKSASTEEQGFFVLNTVFENLEYGLIAPHVAHIWFALFDRLQKRQTVKFVKSLLIFMSLFLVKHGSANLVDSMNSVQPNIFSMILEQIWIPNLKLITGSLEIKLTAVASTRLLCESPVLLDNAASMYWGKMLDSILTLLSRPEEERVDVEPEVPDIAENVGYTATFVSLHHAGKKEEDPLKDIRDPREFLVSSLARLSALSPGKYPQIISANVEPANQAALLQLCTTFNCPII
ncbi:hypothetical protein MLD38_039056 [Melastoma candidum]|nr:hypothetical protein MLD38_039056 [Melastoma candidum]